MKTERKVLITGGAGFVGLNICHKFLEKGIDVVLTDKKPLAEQARIELEQKQGKLVICVGDILDKNFVNNIFRENRITDVIHGAALTPGEGEEACWAEDIIKVNCISEIILMKAFAEQKAGGHFFLLGSISAYGKTALQPEALEEGKSLADPRSIYEISKFTAERIYLRMREQWSVSGCMVRIGDVFGPWEHYSGARTHMSLPYQATALAMKGREAIFSRNYSGTWIYGPDLANAVYILWKEGRFKHIIYPLSSEERWTMAEWCEMLKKYYPNFTYSISGEKEKANVKINQDTDNSPMISDYIFQDTGFCQYLNLEQSFNHYMKWIDSHPGYVI